MPEEQLQLFTGLNWENIIKLREIMTSMRDCQVNTVTQALVVFLVKPKTGNSNKMDAAILQLEHKQLVSKNSESVIKSFEKDILTSRLRFVASSRCDPIAHHTTEIAKMLLCSDSDSSKKLYLIADGT